ncbi:MAG: hypothetical protein GF417_07905 [Candidatus Latescibacteria bacterium]|nr:hypothetical protein [bacterium]MBD3424344.1 hypothetical protein [Candidatus Latescibacterota bacterium]
MSDYVEIIKELSGLGTVPGKAAESFSREFHRIVPVVEQTLEHEGIDSSFIRSGTVHFGRTLEAVYRYSLWEALAAEVKGLAGGLSARGSEDRFSGMLRGWIMGIMSAVGSPEVYQLVRPLELIRERAGLFKSAASAEDSRGVAEYDSSFTSSVLAGRSGEAAERAVSEYRRGVSPDDVLSRLFYPSLVEIGRRWSENLIGVAEEHAATSTLRAAAHNFFDSISVDQSYCLSMMVTCVPGDEHELGPEILSLYLSSMGWKVFFVGRSLPRGDIIRELDRGGYQVSLLSVSLVRHLPSFENLAGEIRGSHPEIFLIAGGAALTYGERVMRELADEVAETPRQVHRILLGLENADA